MDATAHESEGISAHTPFAQKVKAGEGPAVKEFVFILEIAMQDPPCASELDRLRKDLDVARGTSR